MALRDNVRWLALVALASALGCQRCGGGSAQSSGAATATSMEGSAAPSAKRAVRVHGVRGRASGAPTCPRSATPAAVGPPRRCARCSRLTASPSTRPRWSAAECKVDEDGASVDDLEDVAVKYGLEAGSVIVPAEHVLLPEARMLPAIVIVDTTADDEEGVHGRLAPRRRPRPA